MEKKNVEKLIIHKSNIFVIKCYGHISLAFGHIKNSNNEWAEEELNKIQKDF